jgi:hypothetical protein
MLYNIQLYVRQTNFLSTFATNFNDVIENGIN